MDFLGLGTEPAFSFEFISRVVFVLFSILTIIAIGYKIKEGWGAVIAFLLFAVFFLFINGLLWDLHRHFIV